MKSKVWSIGLLCATVSILCMLGICTIVIDPYFHYHKPIEGLQYPIDNQRYQNDGIVKHFEYDAIITGTSMTENFRTSEFDELFGTKSIKVPFSGGSYKEINDLLENAFEANSNIKYVVRGLDGSKLFDTKDTMRYEANLYPTYLYDDSALNDVEYIFNKEILVEGTVGVLLHTMRGEQTTSFDQYSNWSEKFPLGTEAVLSTYSRADKADYFKEFNDQDYENLLGNVLENVFEIANNNPDTEFYYFIPPYSICWWDECNQTGNLKRQIEAFKCMTELIVECDNIKLFSFFSQYDMICDLNNYRDTMHYSEEINSQILRWMKQGEHCLTKDNYLEYWDQIEQYYSNYEYDKLFE